MPKRQPPTPCH